MRSVLLWLIETPARMIGEVIGALWPLLCLVVLLVFGEFFYNSILHRFGHKLALLLSVCASFYLTTVCYRAAHWAGLALLHVEDTHTDDE